MTFLIENLYIFVEHLFLNMNFIDFFLTSFSNGVSSFFLNIKDDFVKDDTTRMSCRIMKVAGPYGSLVSIQFREVSGIFWFDKSTDDRTFSEGDYVDIAYIMDPVHPKTKSIKYIRKIK